MELIFAPLSNYCLLRKYEKRNSKIFNYITFREDKITLYLSCKFTGDFTRFFFVIKLNKGLQRLSLYYIYPERPLSRSVTWTRSCPVSDIGQNTYNRKAKKPRWFRGCYFQEERETSSVGKFDPNNNPFIQCYRKCAEVLRIRMIELNIMLDRTGQYAPFD